MKFVGIGLKRPATLPRLIADVADIGQVRSATINLIIVEDMLIEVDIGHKIPATILLKIREQGLMLKGELDIGLQQANIPPLTKVNVADYCIFQDILLVLMGELDIGPRPSTLLTEE